MRCGLYMGRAARPTKRPMCFDGSARSAAHEMWCTTATTTTTSTVPMRPPTCFDGPARAWWPMRCGVLLLQLRLFSVCLGRYSPKTATFVRCILANRHGCVIEYDAYKRKCRIKALVPLWVCRRHSLPSRRRRRHDVLALVRPADGTAGATS